MILDLESISTCLDMPAIVQLTALRIKAATSYYPVGEFLATIPHADLAVLIVQIEAGETSTMCALAMLLGISEGGEITTPESLIQHSSRLELLVMMEHLDRLGSIKFNRSNTSLSADAGDLPITTLLQ